MKRLVSNFFSATPADEAISKIFSSDHRGYMNYSPLLIQNSPHDVYENAPVVCGFQFEIPVKFCPKDPEHSLMFYGIDMDCEVYMKIYGIYRMLPLAPFKKIREDIPDNILKYLTVSKLACWGRLPDRDTGRFCRSGA